jgi:hypothetical protein
MDSGMERSCGPGANPAPTALLPAPKRVSLQSAVLATSAHSLPQELDSDGAQANVTKGSVSPEGRDLVNAPSETELSPATALLPVGTNDAAGTTCGEDSSTHEAEILQRSSIARVQCSQSNELPPKLKCAGAGQREHFKAPSSTTATPPNAGQRDIAQLSAMPRAK